MELMCTLNASPIQKFYKNQVIFITGGTGFLGSVLIEKLLRCCPDIQKIYLLIRNKKGKNSEQRLDDIFDNEYFKMLKLHFPNFKEKLSVIYGDLSEDKLGVSKEDWDTIVKEVDIIFHAAATVKFDEKLKLATKINIQGTKDMLNLCSDCTKLKSVVHVSTAYSHCILSEIDEKFYEPLRLPDEFLEFCEKHSVEELDEMTPEIIKSYPNTYTFTKGVGEEIVRQYEHKLPISIVRPSIVMGSWKEALPGWMKSIYGPMGVIVGTGMGVIRTMITNQKYKADIIPVDIVVNAIITAAYETSKHDYKTENIKIYNVVSGKRNPITWKVLYFWLFRFGDIYASVQAMWFYIFFSVKSETSYKIYRLLLHMIPGYIVDTLLKLQGKEPMLLKIYEKVDKLISLLKFFSTNQWNFHDKNTEELYNSLSLKDKTLFYFNIEDIEWDLYWLYTTRATRLYIIKDPFDTIKNAQKRMFRFKVVHYTFLTLFLLLVFYLFSTLYRYIF